ncbi:unnamed protein product [Porites evermanni]|uniref:Non-structural maintenance of chromosomes element 1 homolog n=1 Tax=Porites evermanni TaxID=104178 RepID=A0ABN8LJL7_9CNID|nr:unnamed protein product [Porites evermanni]
MRESQRLFLRSLMSKQFLSEKETRNIYRKACNAFGDDGAPENFVNFVEAVNKNLRSLDMEIRQGISEDSGAVHYGLVNTAEDEHSKMATDFSPNEITFFKKVMDAIVTSTDGTVSSLDAMNIGADLDKRINITRAEELLRRLVKDQWMSEVSISDSNSHLVLLLLQCCLMLFLIPLCHRIPAKHCYVCRPLIIVNLCNRTGEERRRQILCNKCANSWMHQIPQLPTSPASQQLNGESSAGPSGEPGPSGRQRKKRR